MFPLKTQRGNRQRTRQSRRRKLAVELLEDRRLLATFEQVNTELRLDLAADEQVSIASTETGYQVDLASGTWSGSNSANVTGHGTAQLQITLAGLSAFDAIAISDSGDGVGVVFAASTSTYTDNFSVVLDGVGSTITVDAAVEFSGDGNNLHLEAAQVIDGTQQTDWGIGIGSYSTAYTVVETFLDGNNIVLSSFQRGPAGEAIISDTGQSLKLSVQTDANNDNRYFGSVQRNSLGVYDLNSPELYDSRIRIVYKPGPDDLNQQTGFTFGLFDQDGSSRERHEYPVPFGSGTSLGDGYFEFFVDPRSSPSHTNPGGDNIVNYGLNGWQFQSNWAEGRQGSAPYRRFEVELKSIELVSFAPTYTVVEQLLNGQAMGSFFTQSDAVVTQQDGFARLSVTADINNDNRYFGLIERGNNNVHNFTPTATSPERVRIVYKAGPENQQNDFNFVLFDQDITASSREQHQYFVEFGDGTPVGDGYFAYFVDLTQPADFIFQQKDGIRNFGFDRWKVESQFGDGQRNGQLGDKFEIDIKTIELVRLGIAPQPDDDAISAFTTTDTHMYAAGYLSGTNQILGDEDLIVPYRTPYIAKYELNGDLVWLKPLRTNAANTNSITDLAVDSLGNVVILGRMTSTMDFDPSSNQYLLDPPHLGTTSNFYLAKYSTDGEFDFANVFTITDAQVNLSRTIDIGGLAVGSDQSIHLTGSLYGKIDFDPDPDPDSGVVELSTGDKRAPQPFVAKFNGNGGLAYASLFTATNPTVDRFASGTGSTIVVDPTTNNAIVAGSFLGTYVFGESNNSTDRNTFVFSVSGTGNIQPNSVMLFKGSEVVTPSAIALDSSQNLYLTGGFFGTLDFDLSSTGTQVLDAGNVADGFLLKLNAAREFVYVKQFDNGGFKLLDIASDGQIVVGGNVGLSQDADPGPATFRLSNPRSSSSTGSFIRLDNAGNFVHAQVLESRNPATEYAQIYGLGIGDDGTVIAAGTFQGTLLLENAPRDLVADSGTNGFIAHFEIPTVDIRVPNLSIAAGSMVSPSGFQTYVDNLAIEVQGGVVNIDNRQSTVLADLTGSGAGVTASGADVQIHSRGDLRIEAPVIVVGAQAVDLRAEERLVLAATDSSIQAADAQVRLGFESGVLRADPISIGSHVLADQLLIRGGIGYAESDPSQRSVGTLSEPLTFDANSLNVRALSPNLVEANEVELRHSSDNDFLIDTRLSGQTTQLLGGTFRAIRRPRPYTNPDLFDFIGTINVISGAVLDGPPTTFPFPKFRNIIVQPGGTLQGFWEADNIVNRGTFLSELKPGTYFSEVIADFTQSADATFEARIGNILSSASPLRVRDDVVLAGYLNLSIGGYSFASEITLIANTGSKAIVGQFIDYPEGYLFEFANRQWQITYKGGTGNDVVLKYLGLLPIQVTTTDDSGPGSLRDAIARSNQDPVHNEIRFEQLGQGVHVFRPASPLPPITSFDTLNGESTAGFDGVPLIVIDGTNAVSADGSPVDGLVSLGGSVALSGLVIGNFSGYGLRGDGYIGLTTSYVGTDETGTQAQPNAAGGLLLNSNSYIYGNLISGNGGPGVHITSGDPYFEANLIGTDISGQQGLANQGDGVRIEGTAAFSTFYGNTIAGNFGHGVSILGTEAFNNQIVENRIGIALDRETPLFNEQSAVHVSGGARNTTIGLFNSEGTSSAIGNTLAAPPDKLVILIEGAGTTGTRIGSNFIGTNEAQTASFGGSVGILVREQASDTRVGLFDAEGGVVTGNLIQGYGTGIRLDNAAGVRVEFANVRDSTQAGIVVENSTGVLIADNTITDGLGTASAGITVNSGDAELRRNVISGNLSSAISTASSPATLFITQARFDGFVLGFVTNAVANSTYFVEFFESTESGQAERFIGARAVVTDANGFSTLEVNDLGDLAPDKLLTATITGNRTVASEDPSTSPLTAGIEPRSAIITGLPLTSPEGKPLSPSAFALENTADGFSVTGYDWEVLKDGELFAAGNEGQIQFTPDDEVVYQVTLELTLTNVNIGEQRFQTLGPYVVNVYNVAPTVQFDIAAMPDKKFSLISDSSDPGQADELTYAWQVRSGTPTGSVVFNQPASVDAQAVEFAANGGGIYYVTHTVEDGDGGVRSLTRQLSVAGLPQAAVIEAPLTGSEGTTIRARAPEADLQRTEELSFTWRVRKISVSGAETSYPFTVPSPGVVEFIPDDDGIYRVFLTLADANNPTDTLPETSVDVTVTNASPVVTVEGGMPLATLNDPLEFTANIHDPGSADTHTVTWTVRRNGDIDTQLVDQDPAVPFVYVPDFPGVYTVEATATDDDFARTQPVGTGSGQTLFLVDGSQATISISTPVGPYREGATSTFTANIPAGTQVVSYVWVAFDINGRTVQESSEVAVDSIVGEFNFVPPQGGEFVVLLSVSLSDGSTAQATSELFAYGLAPLIDEVTITPPIAFEGSVVSVFASASDLSERIGLSYKWELQRVGETGFTELPGAALNPNQFHFIPIDNGNHVVRVTVTDSQGLSATSEHTISVSNVAPTVRLDLDSISADPTTGVLTANFRALGKDTGQADMLTYEWQENGGNFSAPSTSNTYSARVDTLQSLIVRVSDDDNGTVTLSSYILSGTDGNDSQLIDVNVSSSAVSNNAQQIVYLALDGNDTVTITDSTLPVTVFGGAGDDIIDASAATVSVTLTGGVGDDILRGGSGADLLIAGSGTNQLFGGNGNNYYIGGGNDTFTGGMDNDYYEVHFSTVVINDIGGGLDVVDLTAAPQGVSLDFGLTDGSVQSVFTGSTLALNGSFQRLVGSPHNDVFTTDKTDSELFGGDGNDQLISSIAGAMLDGGDGNDELVLVDASGTFAGGLGQDRILGSMLAGSSSSIDAGDGDDFITITGPTTGIKPTVLISGGTGHNTITANGVTGKIYANTGRADGDTSIFGSTTQASTASISVNNSSDIGIFGSATPGSTLAVANSSDVSIFGGAGDTAELNDIASGVVSGSIFGSATTTASVFTAIMNSSSDIEIFGSTNPNVAFNATVTNSSDIGIFGSPNSNNVSVFGGSDVAIFGISVGSLNFAGVEPDDATAGSLGGSIHLSNFAKADVASTLSISISDTAALDIFGSASTGGPTLSAIVTNSSDIEIFGSAAGNANLTFFGSQDIGIFGLLDGTVQLGPTDPQASDAGVNGAVIAAGIFGSSVSDRQLNVTVNNSSDVSIFGSTALQTASLNATIWNSSDVGIFGSATGGMLAVAASSDVSIYGQGSDDVSLDAVVSGNIYTEIFGNAAPSRQLNIVVTGNSSDIGIFGSSRRNASVSVAGSSDVHIFGGTAANTIDGTLFTGDTVTLTSVTDATVVSGVFGNAQPSSPVMNLTVTGNSSDIEIFGSTEAATLIAIGGNSSDIGIFAGYGDDVAIVGDAQRVRVEGGVFGSAQAMQPGLSVTVGGNASDIGIFGSATNDVLTVTGGTRIGADLRAGDDLLSIAGVTGFVGLSDAGDDFVTVESGDDILVYLADGLDRAAVLGGSRVRIIGGEDDDEFYVAGGSDVDLDTGRGDDWLVTADGSDVRVRTDAGNDKLRFFGGQGGLFSGGNGDDSLRIFGSFGPVLDPGLVYAVIDGGVGNDTLDALALLTVEERGEGANPLSELPSWIVLPESITAPEISTSPNSIALLGGLGDDVLLSYGDQRIVLLGGEDSDTLHLASGSNSTLAGGGGNDLIQIASSGTDNYVFGDAGDDTVIVIGGTRLSIYTEEGNDTVAFTESASPTSFAIQSFARGGLGNDHLTIAAGSEIVVAGEVGNDTLEINGGLSALASGGVGDDALTISSGALAVLLGESGRDTLTFTGGVWPILSGGDGDDRLLASAREGDLYGDDGDDSYEILPTVGVASGLLRLRELRFIDGSDFEPLSRGSDTIDFRSFSVGAELDLGLVDEVQVVIEGQLSLLIIGDFENIIGTAGNDRLMGNALPNRLDGRDGHDRLLGLAGNDTLIGGQGDDLLQGGDDDDRYVFSTTSDGDLGADTLFEDVDGGRDLLDFSGLPAGLEGIDLASTAQQSLAGNRLSLTLLAAPIGMEETPLVGELEELVGTPFADIVYGNPLDNRFELGGGDDAVDGGGGSDVYVFAGRNLGADMITGAPDPEGSGGLATLDFSAYDAPLNLDLASTAAQVMGSDLTLQFSSPLAIRNVVGTSYNDTIYGNSLNNALYGAAGSDLLDGREGDDLLVADLPAVVLLDFDSAFNASRGDYDYSVAERNAIQARLEASYAAFSWMFTQVESSADALTELSGRAYVRLAFSEGRGGGVSGDAGEVDFRNISRSVVSEVNINPLKSTVADVLGDNHTPQEFSDAVVALTATIAAHELAHTAGVRHHDAFGPIGSGVFAGADLSRMYPAYDGAIGASETPFHIIASPASVGTSIANAIGITFFGPREAIKLAFNETGQTQREVARGLGSHNTLATAEDLGDLIPLYVPNLAPEGFTDAGKVFKVAALTVVGDLFSGEQAGTTEVDYYKFTGKAGEYVNIELLVNSIRPARGAAFDGLLQIFDADGTMLAENDDDLEGTKDATLFDVQLPADGDYFVRVSFSTQPAIDSAGGNYELFLTRFAAVPAETMLPSSPGDKLIGGSGANVIHGSAADDLFLATDAVFGNEDEVDVLFGHEGVDTLNLEGRSYNYQLPEGHSIEKFINYFDLIAPVEGAVGQPLSFTFIGRGFPAGSRYNINWEDSSPAEELSAVDGTVATEHRFLSLSSQAGFNVIVTVFNADGVQIDQQTAMVSIRQAALANSGVQPVLYVGGSAGRDNIVVQPEGDGHFRVLLADGSSEVFENSSVRRIVIYALAGDDVVTLDPALLIPAEVYGGTGNDRLFGGGGNDILVGGDGHDRLYGYGGSNILIGGDGQDRLYSAGTGDIQIAGWTAFDATEIALRAISDYWTLDLENESLSWYNSRVQTLSVDSVGDSNAYRLDTSTVFDDGDRDILYGDFARPTGQVRSRNWYLLKRSGPGFADGLLQSIAEEIVTDIPPAP